MAVAAAPLALALAAVVAQLLALVTAQSQDVVTCGGFVEASSQLSQCVLLPPRAARASLPATGMRAVHGGAG